MKARTKEKIKSMGLTTILFVPVLILHVTVFVIFLITTLFKEVKRTEVISYRPFVAPTTFGKILSFGECENDIFKITFEKNKLTPAERLILIPFSDDQYGERDHDPTISFTIKYEYVTDEKIINLLKELYEKQKPTITLGVQPHLYLEKTYHKLKVIKKRKFVAVELFDITKYGYAI